MVCGKTQDGSFDLTVDTLVVADTADLLGQTTAIGPVTFSQDLELENPSQTASILLSASQVISDYSLNLPPTSGTAGQILSTDGLGNSSWTTVSSTSGGVTYIAIDTPGTFIKVNGLTNDSTFTSKTFNLQFTPTGSGDQIVLANTPILINPVLGAATGTSLQLSALTASSALATDASKNLVSISNNGTGSNVLTDTPILITPVLGAATGTSLQLSALTASSALATDASKNLVSISNNGTGSNVLTDTPILITPVLGAATGTSLQLSALTASSALATDASKNLVSISNNGTGSNVLTNTPILITPVLGAATGTSLQLSALTASSVLATDPSKNIISVVGTNGQILCIIAGTPTWVNPGSTGVTSVTASSPIFSSGGATPNISVSTTGSGLNFVLNANPNIYALAVDEIRRSTLVATPDPLVFRNGYGVMEPTEVPFFQLPIEYDADDLVISSTHYKTGLNTFEDGSIFIQNGPFNRRKEISDPFLREFIVADLDTYPDWTDPTPPDFTGDINILSRQKISIYSAQDTFIDAANLTLTCPEGNFKLYGDNILLSADFLLDLYSNAFFFHTPLVSLGGIDSQISGTIAWNAALDFEAFGALGSKLYSQGRVFVTSGQYVDIFVQDQVTPIYPTVPCLNGDITLRCNGQFFIPNTPIPPVNIGSINLYSSNTGGIGLYAKGGGVTITTEQYLALNAGITINAQNNGALNLTGGPVSVAANTSLNIQSPRFKVNLPTRDTSGNGVNGAILAVEPGDWTNTYSGGTCPFWSANNLGSIRILSPVGGVTYTTACTLFIDEPTDGDGNTTITNSYSLYVNGRSLFSNLMDIQNKVIFYLHS